jgi:hypothetical protein
VSDKLGTLKYLKLSEVWPHEEHDFTPWLAEEKNLEVLSEALGLELQLDRIEVPVGPTGQTFLQEMFPAITS